MTDPTQGASVDRLTRVASGFPMHNDRDGIGWVLVRHDDLNEALRLIPTPPPAVEGEALREALSNVAAMAETGSMFTDCPDCTTVAATANAALSKAPPPSHDLHEASVRFEEHFNRISQDIARGVRPHRKGFKLHPEAPPPSAPSLGEDVCEDCGAKLVQTHIDTWECGIACPASCGEDAALTAEPADEQGDRK